MDNYTMVVEGCRNYIHASKGGIKNLSIDSSTSHMLWECSTNPLTGAHLLEALDCTGRGHSNF